MLVNSDTILRPLSRAMAGFGETRLDESPCKIDIDDCNVDDRKPVPLLSREVFGRVYAEKARPSGG